METLNYRVKFSEFSQRHYIKKFAKKYKANWSKTQIDIVDICQRINNLLASGRQQAKLIKATEDQKLIKLEFAVEGTRKSPKSSGCRAILWVDETQYQVTVLMVYSKNDVVGNHETAWWQKTIKNHFTEISEIFF